ncbi:MAG TPA: class I SAM-dependent methyltransferase [Longimicrobium sp.]|jgi:demethylmenaquinone methyltransferase/2-methoxy-6-polyprenyl-1,4-benzoquinol methylase
MSVEAQSTLSEHSKEHYNALGERYTEILNARAGSFGLGSDRNRCRLVFEFVRRHFHGKILELCCGPGNFTFVMGEHLPYSTIVGTDHSEKFIEIARCQNTCPNVSFAVQDATRLSYPDESFDTSVVSLALHEMEEDDIRSVLNEMRRVTRNGGKIILIELHIPENPIARLMFEQGLGDGERPTTYRLNDYGLPRFLADAGIAMAEHRIICMSTVQIAVGVKGAAELVPTFHRDFTSFDPWQHLVVPSVATFLSTVSGLVAHQFGGGPHPAAPIPAPVDTDVPPPAILSEP